MKKSVLLIAAAALACSTSFAQLSTRENNATVEKLGARPVAGDMALTFGFGLFNGAQSDDITGQSERASLNVKNSLQPGDFLTFKKYKTDDVAYRLGIRLFKNTAKYKGESDSLLQQTVGQTIPSSQPGLIVETREFKHSVREYNIVPGIEKHYNAANIFDVYCGGDLYLGWKRNVDVDNEEYLRGDKQSTKTVTSGVVVGLGGLVGFNVFLGHLPVSLGLEYGWNAKWTRGGKTKVEVDNLSNGTSTSETYFTENIENNGGAYSKLSQSEFGMNTNQNVRVVLNIYFSKGK